MRRLTLACITPLGDGPGGDDATTVSWEGSDFTVTVGDSRKGWVDAHRF